MLPEPGCRGASGCRDHAADDPGGYTSHARSSVAAKLGISDLLAMRRGRAPRRNWLSSPRRMRPPLYRVLRLLAALNVLREQPVRTFCAHAARRAAADRRSWDRLRYWALLTDQPGGLRPFDRIFDTVMSGEAGLKLAYDDKCAGLRVSRQPPHRNSRNLQAAMSERTAAFAPSVAATYDASHQMRRGSSMRRAADVTLLASLSLPRAPTLMERSCLTCPRSWPAAA